MPKVCVIIVSYNGEEYIHKCLSSLENCSLELNVIIIDNNSKDNTLQIIKEDFPHVDLIKSKKNLGFGKANNLGLVKAYKKGYDYFFLLNQDAWIQEGAIENAVKILEKDASFGIVSPIHMNGTGDKLQGDFEFFMEKDEDTNFLDHYRSNNLSSPIYEVDFVNAAAWIVSRNALQKVGLFHPLFFHYGEDDNYVNRLHSHTLKIGVVANSIIYHDHEPKPFNPLKDSPAKQLRQELLRAYLNPQNKGKEDDLRVHMGQRKRWLIKHKSLNRITAKWIMFKTKRELNNHEEKYSNYLFQHLAND